MNLKTKKAKSKSLRRPRNQPIHVFDLCRTLGSDSDTISRSLLRLGLRGRRTDGYYCPLSRYLRAHRYPESTRVVATCVYDMRDGSVLGWLPPAVSEFVRRFDNGFYDELVEKPNRG